MLFYRFLLRWALGWMLAAVGVPLLLAAALLVGRTLTGGPAPVPVVAAPATA